jgi:imidazolonepropionase-like amidohydrolase
LCSLDETPPIWQNADTPIHLGIINYGALWPRDGKIQHLGRNQVVTPPDADEIDAEGRILLAGFVDARTHLAFAGCRADEFERRTLGESHQSIAAPGGRFARRFGRPEPRKTQIFFANRSYLGGISL